MSTTTERRRARLRYSLVALVPALLFGFLVTVQWRTQIERSEIAVRYNAPLTDAAHALQNEQNQLKAQLAELRARLDDIQRSAATQSGATRDLQQRLEALKTEGGLSAVIGDGVMVTLDDARQVLSPLNKDVDKSICHSTDITDILNTAWRGGAAAIAVNGERIVGSSSVYCVGSTIMVNGTLMSPPFAIVVVGPQDRLLASFDDPAQLRDLKQRRDVQGLGFRVTRASALRVNAFAGALSVRYAQPR